MHVSTISSLFLFNVLAAASDANTANTISTAGNLVLISQLQDARTAADRIALIPNDLDLKYDFLAPPEGAVTTGKGGHTVRSDRFIGPCGFNTPHTHPRSSEINIVVEGRLGTEFIAENGARPIQNTLNKYQMTVFPQGAVHTEFNPDCENAVFVAGFASEDPGVQQSGQTFFGLEDDIVEATLNVKAINWKDIDSFRKLIPANVALGVESCLRKCGIQKN